MNLYHVSLTYILRVPNTAEAEGTMTVRRWADSPSSAISVVSALWGNLSNYTYKEGIHAGKKYLEVKSVQALIMTE